MKVLFPRHTARRLAVKQRLTVCIKSMVETAEAVGKYL